MADCGCLQCGHRWRSKHPAGPRCCPACGSTRWNRRGVAMGSECGGLPALILELRPGQSRLFANAHAARAAAIQAAKITGLRLALSESPAGLRVERIE